MVIKFVVVIVQISNRIVVIIIEKMYKNNKGHLQGEVEEAPLIKLVVSIANFKIK